MCKFIQYGARKDNGNPLFTGASCAASAKRCVAHDPYFQATPRQLERLEYCGCDRTWEVTKGTKVQPP